MQKIADRLDDDTASLIDRWEGRPDYIIEDIFKVRDLETKEISDLDLTNYQRQFVHAYFYGDSSTVNVLKGRRTGYSFIACACILLDCLKTPHGFFAITGPSKSQAKDRIEDIYDLMEWSRLDFNPAVDNRDEIELRNGATIMAFAGNPDTSRGADSADTLYIDEMDFLDDQEESMRAFSPFVALGDAQTIEVSTANYGNSLFMQDHKRGGTSGENGIISIYQPAFENPDNIDEEVSLLKQDVEPVMPYLDLEEAEKDRARDPKGFRQEYLCEPVENEYRFFSEPTVERAIEKGKKPAYDYGLGVGPVHDGTMVMGVDIAGSGKDDTAVAIVEHDDDQRYLRYHEAISDNTLASAGIEPAVSKNPSAIAERIKQLYRVNQVDYIITDATNIGEGFDSEIQQTIGRGVHSFNFSDKESAAEMMGDLNYGFHNDLVTLIDDDQLRDQLLAIVKEKKRKGTKPRFSGKEYSPDGKDDLAISFALAAYPPTINSTDRSLKTKNPEEHTPTEQIEFNTTAAQESNSDSSGYRGASHRQARTRSTDNSGRYKRRYAR